MGKDVAVEEAGRARAARFARDAYSLQPDEPQIRRLYLVATLENAAVETGLDRPLPTDKDSAAGKAAAMGAATIEDALAYALEHGFSGAAAATARILGQQPEAERLLHRGGQPCPLVLATRYPAPRVRWAAVEAIMAIQPRESYPGSSYVFEAMGFFASSRGARRAIVASPSTQQAQRIAGYLAGMGIETDWAPTGRELVRMALLSPDYELALIDAGIDLPTVDILVQQLRRDGRTALLPVGIFAREDQFDRARRVAERTARAEAFYRPQEQAAAQWQVERVLALAGPNAVGPADRVRFAGLALERLDELSRGRGRVLYDLGRVEAPVLGALAVPAVSGQAAAVLANLGTAQSQQSLVELASRPMAPAADRLAAASAFTRSVERYGILLTTPEIRLQYDRYNQSARRTRRRRRILGLILDSIEAPTRAAASPARKTPQQGSTAASVMR